jgi:hypothetical protein
MRGFSACFLVCFSAVGLTAQTPIAARLTGFRPGEQPAVVHVFEVTDPAAGKEVWREVAVVRDSGRFEVSGPASGVAFLVFECPPYRWQVLVRAGETAVAECRPPTAAALRLHGIPGGVRWVGSHPSAALDSLAVTQARLEAEAARDLLLLSGGVAGGTSLVDAQRVRAVQEAFRTAVDRARRELAGAEPAFLDAVAAAEARWSRTWSVGGKRMASPAPERAGRIDDELLRSPGYVAWMREEWAAWWKHPSLDGSALRSAIATLPADSLKALGAAMGLPEGDAWHWGGAWLVRAIEEPGPTVDEVFRRFSFSPAIEDAYRTLRDERAALPGLEGVQWLTPAEERVLAEDALGKGWEVLLIVRNGSATAERERELLAGIRERSERRDVGFTVLSVDPSIEAWEATVAARRSRERLGWLGNDPRAFRRLGLTAVPQAIMIGPDGRFYPDCSVLPSRGLEECLGRLPR